MIGYCWCEEKKHKLSDYWNGKKIPMRECLGIMCVSCGELIMWD